MMRALSPLLRSRKSTRGTLILLALLAVLWALEQRPWSGSTAGPTPGCAAIVSAFESRRSDLMVECEGTVTRVLSDDERGSRHQRFVLEIGSGHTVLVAHNIDLASRVADLRRGDRVRFRGEYEYNEQGGVVHWTHDDPQGRRQGGWIEHDGRRVR